MKKTSFAPAGSLNPRIMIVGSMPGEASLNAGQYYAHPQNAFWRVMGALFGAGPDLPYDVRMAILADRHIAVWDSVRECVRVGSLDSAIRDEVPHDFAGFLATHRNVTHIFFNGAKAEASFKKHVLPTLKTVPVLVKLPSTSPAHAGMTFANKLAAWSVVKDVLEN